MKKNRFLAVLLCALMVFGLLPTAAFADDPAATPLSVLYVGGYAIGTDAEIYWKTDSDGAFIYGTSTDWNIYYNGRGTLALNGATIKTGSSIAGHMGAAIYATGGLTLEITGESTVTAVPTEQGSVGVYATSGDLTIQGNGTLNANGGTPTLSSGKSAGVSALNGDILIQGSVSVNTAGSISTASSYGIRTVYETGLNYKGDVTLATTGTVTATGNGYGIEAVEAIAISVGTVTTKGGLAAMNKAPSVSIANAQYTASENITGTPTTTYEAANISNYKYLQTVALIPLPAPTNLAWSVLPGIVASWAPVANAVSYSVQLYKAGGTALGSAISVTTGTRHNFVSAIGAAGTGSYTFTVTAIGNGTGYSNSNESAPSAAFSSAVPEIIGTSIYGNGNALIIQAGATGGNSTVYMDFDRDGMLDSGDPSLKDAGITNAPEDNSDLSSWTVYGAGNTTEGIYDTKITMLSGKVSAIYGGGSTGSVTGDTSIAISGGTVTGSVFGGGDSGAVSGDKTVSVSGDPSIGGINYFRSERSGVQLSSITGGKVTVSGALTSGARIYLLDPSATTSGTVVAEATNSAHIDTKYFVMPNTALKKTESTHGAELQIDFTHLAPTCHNYEIFANGTALVIESTGESTSGIYIDENRDGVRQPAELDLYSAKVSGAPPTTNDLSRNWLVFGGAESGAAAYDTQIVMASGSIATIYGGSKTGTLTGDTNVIINGGRVTSAIYGGSQGSISNTGDSLTGDTHVTINDGTLEGGIYGGSNQSYAPVNGNTSVAITAGTIANSSYVYTVCGGSYNSVVTGNTNVTISGGTVNAFVCGGSQNKPLYGSSSVNISGGTLKRNVYGGGSSEYASVSGSSLVTISGSAVLDDVLSGGNVYGGGDRGAVSGNSGVIINGGTLKNNVYGGSKTGAVTGNKTVSVLGAPSIDGASMGIDLSSITGNKVTITGELIGADGGIKLIPSAVADEVIVAVAETPSHANAAKFAFSSAQTGYSLAQNSTAGTVYIACNTSTLTVEPNGGAWSGSTSAQSFTQGYNTTKSIPVPTRIGYTFTGWTRTNNYGTMSSLTEAAIYTFGSTSSVADTITAGWRANEYAVAYNGNKPSDASGTVTNVPSGANCTYDIIFALGGAPALTGYAFGGWYKDADCADTNRAGDADDETSNLTGENRATVTLYAKWMANSYIVSLDKNGGNTDGAATAIYDATSLNGVTAPAKTCYEVEGYYYAGVKVANADGTLLANTRFTDEDGKWNVENGATLIAHWTARNYTVTYDAAGGSAVPAGNYDIEDTSFTLSAAPTKTGYSFSGWKVTSAATGGTGFELNDKFSGTTRALNASYGNVTLTAEWTANSYAVTLDKQGGTGGTTDINPTYDSAMPAITKPAREYTVTYNYNYAGATDTADTAAYSFGGYYSATDGSGTQYYTAAGASARMWNGVAITTLYADWTPGSVTLPASARTNYIFSGWYADAACTALVGRGGASYTPTASTTLYAKWTSEIHAITYNANGGTGTMTGGTAAHNIPFKLPACGFTAPAGKQFKEWAIGSTGGTKVAAGGEYTFTALATVYAIWEDMPDPIEYEIIEGENGRWEKGSGSGLKFTANGDYGKFTGVLVDGSPISGDKYTAESGSTVVTLKKSYLETLAAGRHTLRINFMGGYAETSFIIKANSNNPSTGDASQPMLWIGIALLAGAGFAASLVIRRKRQNG